MAKTTIYLTTATIESITRIAAATAATATATATATAGKEVTTGAAAMTTASRSNSRSRGKSSKSSNIYWNSWFKHQFLFLYLTVQQPVEPAIGPVLYRISGGEYPHCDHPPCAAEAVNAGRPNGVVHTKVDEERVCDVGQKSAHRPDEDGLEDGDQGAAGGHTHQGAKHTVDRRKDVNLGAKQLKKSLGLEVMVAKENLWE